MASVFGPAKSRFYWPEPNGPSKRKASFGRGTLVFVPYSLSPLLQDKLQELCAPHKGSPQVLGFRFAFCNMGTMQKQVRQPQLLSQVASLMPLSRG